MPRFFKIFVSFQWIVLQSIRLNGAKCSDTKSFYFDHKRNCCKAIIKTQGMMFVLWKMFIQSHYWPVWWLIFSTNTSVTTVQKDVMHYPWCTCSCNHLKSPFHRFLGIILLYSTPSCFSRDDLFIDWHNFFRFHFQTIRLYHFKQWSNFEQFIIIFSSFNELSTRSIELHKSLYLFLDNVAAIILTLVSTAQ